MTAPEIILSLFQERFSKSVKMYFAPGSINLLGEHVDYNDGLTLPAAIDMGIWLAVYKNNTNRVNIIASDISEEVCSFILPTPSKEEGWKNLVVTLLQILHKKQFVIDGFDCVFGGNIPSNIGLGEQAAFISGLLFAINELMQLQIPIQELATIAIEVEQNIEKKSYCGINTYATIFGKANHCLHFDCLNKAYETISITTDEYQWVLIDAGIEAKDFATLNERRIEAFEALSFFTTVNKKIKSYRFVNHAIVEQFSYMMTDEIYNKAMFITQEIERVKEGAILLQQSDLIAFGKLMYKSHSQLSELYEVSCSELDFLVAEAKMQYDVIGAKMMGNSCTLNLIHKENIQTVINQMTNAFENVYKKTPTVHFITLSDGVKEVNPSEYYYA
ncbi:MAG: galactokinase [Chitinophagaceae bacterium]